MGSNNAGELTTPEREELRALVQVGGITPMVFVAVEAAPMPPKGVQHRGDLGDGPRLLCYEGDPQAR